MLEADIKPRTIILERRTAKGTWVFCTKITKDGRFDRETIFGAMKLFREGNSDIRAVSSKGVQLLTSRGGLGFLRTCETVNLISLVFQSEENKKPELFSKDNPYFKGLKDLQELIVENGGLDRFKIRSYAKEGEVFIEGDIRFMNKRKASVAFY